MQRREARKEKPGRPSRLLRIVPAAPESGASAPGPSNPELPPFGPHRTRCLGVRSFSSVRCPALQRRGHQIRIGHRFPSPPGNELPGCRGAADGTEVPYSRAPAVQEYDSGSAIAFHLLLAMNCQVAAVRRTELKFRTPGHLRCKNTTAVRPSPPGNELPGCRGDGSAFFPRLRSPISDFGYITPVT
jgi:hypothetical protein